MALPSLTLVNRHDYARMQESFVGVSESDLARMQESFIGVSESGICLEHGNDEYDFITWDIDSLFSETRVRRPENVKARSDKYKLVDGRWAVRKSNDSTTYLLSGDMASVTTHYTGDYGVLRGVVPDGLLYVKSGDTNKYDLKIFSPDHTHLATLPQAVDDDRVSVSCHPSSRQFVVLCAGGDVTLDIYATRTSQPRRIQIPRYYPWKLNGVTATREGIFVACYDPPELYMYGWDGVEICKFSKQDLSIEELGILAVGRVSEDRLMVATGLGEIVSAVYIYRLTHGGGNDQ